MVDIESMYLQHCIPAVDQSSLKFLWFDHGDLHVAVVEMHMTSPAFGITSSGDNAAFLL